MQLVLLGSNQNLKCGIIGPMLILLVHPTVVALLSSSYSVLISQLKCTMSYYTLGKFIPS